MLNEIESPKADKIKQMTTTQPSILKLFNSFFRLGLTAFGRPSMVAYIRKMAVEEKHYDLRRKIKMKFKLIFKDRCQNDELLEKINVGNMKVLSESKIEMGI